MLAVEHAALVLVRVAALHCLCVLARNVGGGDGGGGSSGGGGGGNEQVWVWRGCGVYSPVRRLP